MGILSPSAPPVRARFAEFLGRVEPGPDEPYTPTPQDLAYDTGWVVGREQGKFSPPDAWIRDGRAWRYAQGRQEGVRARESEAAFELGEALGYAEGPTEPPGGYRPHEAAAFRKGYALGLDRFEEERAYDAWVDAREPAEPEFYEAVEAIGVVEARRL